MFKGLIKTVVYTGIVVGGLYIYGEIKAPEIVKSNVDVEQISPLEKGVMGAADLSVKAKDQLDLFVDTYKARSTDKKLLRDERETGEIYVTKGFCQDMGNYLADSVATTKSDIRFLQEIYDCEDLDRIRGYAKDKLLKKENLLKDIQYYQKLVQNVQE